MNKRYNNNELFTIVCVKQGEIIGFWADWKILTREIHLYDKEDVEREAENCRPYIARKYDPDILPVVMPISIKIPMPILGENLQAYIKSIENNFSNDPNLINQIKTHIKL